MHVRSGDTLKRHHWTPPECFCSSVGSSQDGSLPAIWHFPSLSCDGRVTMQNGFWMWLGVGMCVFLMVLEGMAQKQCLWCYHNKRKLLQWAAQQVKIWSIIMIHWLRCCKKKTWLEPTSTLPAFRPILSVRRWDILWTQSQYYKSLSLVIRKETLCFNACLLASAMLCDFLISCGWSQ